jgi:hypothetical protein
MKIIGIRSNLQILFAIFCLALGVSACYSRNSHTPTAVSPLGTEEEKELGIELIFVSRISDDWGRGEQKYGSFDDRAPAIFAITRPEEINLVSTWLNQEAYTVLEDLDYISNVGVVVFQGYKPSSGYGIRIERVTRDNDIINVYASVIEPEPDIEVLDIITSPYQLVEIGKDSDWEEISAFNLIVEGKIVASDN